MAVKKIISGVQTGADRAALDCAIANNIPHGGWVPKGRNAEDGIIPETYEVQESPSKDYKRRTELNVRDSDGTLILTHGKLTGGSTLTLKYAQKHDKPCLHINLDETSESKAAKQINQWINQNHIETLNCAGSRASKDPEIYSAMYNILETVLNPDKAVDF